MITKEFAETSAEIAEILSYLPVEYVDKIPLKLREFFKKVADKDYVSNIDPYKTLDKQDMKPKTKTLLTIIYREYWCNEEERTELDKILIENDKLYEAELREKYNPYNIFKKNDDNEKFPLNNELYENTTLPIEVKKERFYEKIINFFKNLFHIN